MNVDDFAELAKSLFERIGKLDSPGGKRLWEPVVREGSHRQCEALLREFAYKGDRMPSPKVFHEALQDDLRDPGVRPQEIREQRRTCGVCDASIGEFFMDGAWHTMWGCGGLMFREREGRWSAVRCWGCGGPERHADLPVSGFADRAGFVPSFQTPLHALELASARQFTGALDLEDLGPLAAPAAWIRLACAVTREGAA